MSLVQRRKTKADQGHNFCVNCGNELSSSFAINYCQNCGIKKENRIGKYTSEGILVSQTKGQDSISTRAPARDGQSEVSDTGSRKPSSSKSAAISTIILIIIIIIVPVADWFYQQGLQTDKPLEMGCDPEASGRMGIPTIWSCPALRKRVIDPKGNWFYQQGLQTDKLLELGCDPEASGRMGIPTIWSCPAWRNIDVNDPKTYMDQSPAGPNR